LDLELDQLDLRYGSLRIRSTRREERLLASMAEVGQLVPIAVVDGERETKPHVVVDGFKRVRALRRLHEDTVRAVRWDMSEVEALLLSHSLRASEGMTALEQAWLLDELQRRFGLGLEELARQFEHDPSWVSRRLALVRELPVTIQEAVREGRIAPHAAAKHLVPMARQDGEHCERLARAISQAGLSTREVGTLYAGWREGTPATRQRLLSDPLLYLRACRSLEGSEPGNPTDEILKDVAMLAAIARRARRRAREGPFEFPTTDRDGLLSSVRVARSELQRLLELLEARTNGGIHDRPEHTISDPRAQEARPPVPGDRADPQGVAQGCASGDRKGDDRGPAD
jgi:ParB/RepB/Spo0J family partition protein